MTLRTLSLALLLSAPLLPACDSGGDEEEGPNVDCATATVPKYTEMSAWGKCITCHNSNLSDTARQGAPAGVNYDTYEGARANAQTAMDEVFAGTMPLAGQTPLTEAEKTQIYNWASCDTPN